MRLRFPVIFLAIIWLICADGAFSKNQIESAPRKIVQENSLTEYKPAADFQNPGSAGAEANDRSGYGVCRRWASCGEFAEVEIVLNERFTLEDVRKLAMAPGDSIHISRDSESAKVQLPAGEVERLAEKNIEFTILRKFLLVEGSANSNGFLSNDFEISGSCSGNYRFGESDEDVYIPLDGSWYGSGIEIYTAPAGSTVTCIDVCYEIQHDYWSWLYVELSDWDYDSYTYPLYGDWYGGSGYIYECESGITAFNGRDVNQWWILWARDGGPYGGGYIDYWWIKVYYDNSPYCGAGGVCDEYISGVVVGSVNNTGTGCSEYTDYTHLSAVMQIGTSYSITVTNPVPYPGDQCGIWVDWNQDYDFEDATEQIAVSGGPATFNATITPPPGAALGDTRMRVRIMYTGTLSPCGTTEWGEVEDYTITVTPGTAPLSVSGYVKTAAQVGIPDVSVTVTGGGGTVLTDSNGCYQTTVLGPWTGTITPAKALWSFAPTQRSYTGRTTDITDADFTGTYTANQTPKISGYVTKTDGYGLRDVLVAADSGQSDTTNSSGYYEFTVSSPGPIPEPWDGVVTPGKDYWEFNPLTIVYSDLSDDIADQNYTATYTGNPSPVISGFVTTELGQAAADILVKATNGGSFDVTDSAGYYEVTVPAPWDGFVIAQTKQWSFEPASVCHFDVVSDITDQNFVGTCYGDFAAVSRYKIIDLGTAGIFPQGYNYSGASCINDFGQVVGCSSNEQTTHWKAFFWEDVNDNGLADLGEMITIDTLWDNDTFSSSRAVNNNGHVVGWGGNPEYPSPFLWQDTNGNHQSDPGEMQRLTTLPDTFGGIPKACNDYGIAAGFCKGLDEQYNACLWDLSNNSVKDINSFTDYGSSATGINNAGQVAGYMYIADGNGRAFVWTDEDADGAAEPGEAIDLGTLGGRSIAASSINNAGQVIGNAWDAEGKLNAFIWEDKNHNGVSDPCEMQKLVTVGFGSRVGGINDNGTVVGTYDAKKSDYTSRQAFLWSEDWGMVELQELLCNGARWEFFLSVRSINNKGQIVGQGFTVDGEFHAFLMTPIMAADLDCSGDVDANDLAELCRQWLRPELTADFVPLGGDGLVNFYDWAVFALAWDSNSTLPDWDPRCDIYPEQGDEIIDVNDLSGFAEQWLRPGAYFADIAPFPTGDGIVNWKDFVILAEQWQQNQ